MKVDVPAGVRDAKLCRTLVGNKPVVSPPCRALVARLAAQRVAAGSVTGADLNASMLSVARAMANCISPLSWVECSALDLPFAPGRFDVVLCQLGLQFFPDQPKALREMYRVVRPHGRIALSVYSTIERTPGAYAFVRVLRRTHPRPSHTLGAAA
jgi:ubiquinone/menaquinone biosynthesis C-methylase UbiE